MASADYLATAGGATTVFAFVCSATKVCPAFVLIDSTNVEKATAGNPLRVDPTGTTPQPVNATQTGTWTVQPGNTANTTAWKVDGSAVTQPVSPTTAANWGIGTTTYNSALVANGQVALGQFLTAPGTLTTTNMAPFQLDANGNLRVNVMVGGGGGGGLSVMDTAAFTAGSSNFTPGGGVFNDAATLTTGQQGTFRMTTKRAQVIDVDTTGNQLHADMIAPIPACAASPCVTTIGRIGIDHTTPGTTDGITIFPDSSAGTSGTTAVAGTTASSVVAKASAGNLQNAYVTSSAAGWVFIINAASLPANATLTIGTASGNLQGCFELQKGVTDWGASINYNPGPWEHFSTGIVVAISSTDCPVLTAASTGKFLHSQAN
jgi:hypothetical protein